MGEDLEGERKGAGGFGEGIYRGEDWSKTLSVAGGCQNPYSLLKFTRS